VEAVTAADTASGRASLITSRARSSSLASALTSCPCSCLPPASVSSSPLRPPSVPGALHLDRCARASVGEASRQTTLRRSGVDRL